jgi:hypothetical protein
MRSKKTVLLVCPNEITASHLTVTIGVWGYRVVTVNEIAEAEKLLPGVSFDLVVLMPSRDRKEFRAFCQRAKRIDAQQRLRGEVTRVFDSMKMLPSWAPEGVSHITGEVMSAELLRNGMRLALRRKRGPRHPTVDLAKAA